MPVSLYNSFHIAKLFAEALYMNSCYTVNGTEFFLLSSHYQSVIALSIQIYGHWIHTTNISIYALTQSLINLKNTQHSWRHLHSELETKAVFKDYIIC